MLPCKLLFWQAVWMKSNLRSLNSEQLCIIFWQFSCLVIKLNGRKQNAASFLNLIPVTFSVSDWAKKQRNKILRAFAGTFPVFEKEWDRQGQFPMETSVTKRELLWKKRWSKDKTRAVKIMKKFNVNLKQKRGGIGQGFFAPPPPFLNVVLHKKWWSHQKVATEYYLQVQRKEVPKQLLSSILPMQKIKPFCKVNNRIQQLVTRMILYFDHKTRSLPQYRSNFLWLQDYAISVELFFLGEACYFKWKRLVR